MTVVAKVNPLQLAQVCAVQLENFCAIAHKALVACVAQWQPATGTLLAMQLAKGLGVRAGKALIASGHMQLVNCFFGGHAC